MDAYFAKTKREKEEREVEEKAAKYAAEVKANREKSAAERNEKIPVGPAEEPAKGAELDLGHSFRDIQVWEKSPFTASEVTAGMQHEGVKQWLENEEHQCDLHIVPTWEGKDAAGVVGQYVAARWNDFDKKTEGNPAGVPDIYVDCNRMTLGDDRPWGECWGVSEKSVALAGDRINPMPASPFEGRKPSETTVEERMAYAEAMGKWRKEGGALMRKRDLAGVQGTFIHELGHAISLNYSSQRLKGLGQTPVATIMRNAYQSRGFADSTGPTHLAEAVHNGEAGVKNPAISRYAATNAHEYFAESFAAYLTHPKELKEHDPIGHAMVSDVLQALNIERKKP